MKKIFVAVIIAVAVPAQASAESWLCIPDMATGFHFDQNTKQWKQSNFNVAGRKYVIRPSDITSSKFVVTDFGREASFVDPHCEFEPNELGILFCNGLFTTFTMNGKSLRYVRTSPAGYAEVDGDKNFLKDGDRNLSMEIGRCSKI